MRWFLLGLGFFIISSVSQAQMNFVKNGDFSQGMKFWTGSGPGGNPKVENFDTTGCGANPAFAINPGGNTYNPPHPPYILKQNIVIPKVKLEMTLDVCLKGPSTNAQWGIIEVKIGGTKVVSWTKYAGRNSPGTYREHLTFVFTPPKPGPQDLELLLSRPKYIWSSRTPRMYIDNINLTIHYPPSLYVKTERKLGGLLMMDLLGSPSSAAILALSTTKGTGLSIPGFNGTFWLNPARFWIIAMGQFNSSGSFSVKFPIPNLPAITGIPLWFEGIEVGTTSGSFGLAHSLCFYK